MASMKQSLTQSCFFAKDQQSSLSLNRQKQMTAYSSFTHNFQTYYLQSQKAVFAIFPLGYAHSYFSSFLQVVSSLPPTHCICHTIFQPLYFHLVSKTPLPFSLLFVYYWVPLFLQWWLFQLFLTITVHNLHVVPFTFLQRRLNETCLL